MEKIYYKIDILYIIMYIYNIFIGKSFLKVIVLRNVKNCIIYNYYRVEKIVDVKLYLMEFGYYLVG